MMSVLYTFQVTTGVTMLGAVTGACSVPQMWATPARAHQTWSWMLMAKLVNVYLQKYQLLLYMQALSAL